jgi:hypothetical protein
MTFNCSVIRYAVTSGDKDTYTFSPSHNDSPAAVIITREIVEKPGVQLIQIVYCGRPRVEIEVLQKRKNCVIPSGRPEESGVTIFRLLVTTKMPQDVFPSKESCPRNMR